MLTVFVSQILIRLVSDNYAQTQTHINTNTNKHIKSQTKEDFVF